MSPDHLYYLITGDPVLSRIAEYQLLAKTSLALSKALAAELGAIAAYGGPDGIHGFSFPENNAPSNWVKVTKKGRYCWKPKAKLKANQELLARMAACPLPGSGLFRKVITGRDDCFMFMTQDLTGMSLGYECLAGNHVMAYPNPPGGKWMDAKNVWEMPAEGTRLLTPAEYYRLKADSEESPTAA